MKKLFLIFLLCFCAGFGAMFWVRPYLPQDEENTVHVFFEAYATNPALCQIIEFARLPKSARKIIAWHRFANRKNVIDLKHYNAIEVDIPNAEALYAAATQKVFTAVWDMYVKNPKTKFVLYVNLSHSSTVLAPFFNQIPKQNIKHVHLYEDGFGELFKGPFNPDTFRPRQGAQSTPIETQLEHALKKEIPWRPIFSFSIHKIYPTTYHLMHADKIKSQAVFEPLRAWLKGAKLETVDFDLLNKTLPDEQKAIVYKLTGFDYDKYYKLMHGKQTVMFVLGLLANNPVLDKAELNIITSIRRGQLKVLTDGKNYQWFCKPHPSLSGKDKIKEIKKRFPDVIEVPPQVPFEVFILAGLKPTKTAGYGSSLFFSLKPGDVLAYIHNKGGNVYLQFLKENLIVGDGKSLNLGDFTDTALKNDCLNNGFCSNEP